MIYWAVVVLTAKIDTKRIFFENKVSNREFWAFVTKTNSGKTV